MNRRLLRPLLVAAVLCAACVGRTAEPARFLGPDAVPAAARLLPAPAEAGSAEQTTELALLHAVHDHATADQLAAAQRTAEFDVFTFAAQIGPWFEGGRLPRTAAFFAAIENDTRAVTRRAKDQFRRPRPFVADPTLVPLAVEHSPSYPSGHATRATVVALVLAELFPEHREALLAAAREIGFHRIVAAVHYPSDVYAGRVLGQAIAQALLRDASFQAELEAVRAEVAAARAAAPVGR